MNGLLSSISHAIERITALSTSSCCGCQKDLRWQGASITDDAGLARVFAPHPLSEAGPEAVRATQRGARLLHEKRYVEALRELHVAYQLAPESLEACCNLGCAYHMNGDHNTALYWYREAHSMAPTDETTVLALSLLEMRRGQGYEAKRLLVRFLQDVDSAHIGALRQLGRIHQHEEHWSKAAGCFHQLMSIDPANTEWPSQLQLCLDQMPLRDGRGVPVPNANGVPGVCERAFSFAEPVVRNAVPTHEESEGVKAKAVAGASGTGSSRASTAGGGAGTANVGCSLVGGMAPTANRAAVGVGAESSTADSEVISARGPSNGYCRIHGSQQPHSGNATPTSAADEKVRGATSVMEAQLQEARQLREGGRLKAALAAYEALLQYDRGNAEALLGFVGCSYELDSFDVGLEAGKHLLAIRPDDAEANLLVAELLLAVGHEVDMVEPYLKRAQRDVNCGRTIQHRLLCAMADTALAREDHAKALAHASEAVRLDASKARALILLGNARLHVADYAGAQRALSKALDESGNGAGSSRLRATAHTLSAQAHERLRQYSEALTQVSKAFDQIPQFIPARIVHAMVLQQNGKNSGAEAELEEVLQCEPQNSAARLQLGYSQLCRGDPAAAATLGELAAVAGVPRNSLGAAKVYLAMALDAHPEPGGQQRTDLVVKEGHSLHQNLQHVWREIEAGPPGQPVAAVQKLRGICDLDLTSMQARQLLKLLARAMGRTDLARAINGLAPSVGARGRSVPPSRWAPSGATMDCVAGSGASTPLGGAPQRAWRFPPPPLLQQQQQQQPYRGRSSSPAPLGQQHFAGSCTPGGGEAVMERAARSRPRANVSRDRSPSLAAGDPLTIGWNELIRPEQLAVGPPLGSGGSAQVYRGCWNGQEVAIKKISGVAHLEEMRKEINALRRLRHPRLVRFIGACVQPPLLLVVTEFMSGGSLHDRLFGQRRSPPLIPVQKWVIGVHMAEGLSFLHSQRVVHRDLKSMNILLDAMQSAKICDFGLAQQMEATSIARKLDGEGGSPRYMAPECYDAAHGKLTEKVDIWALGCILLELFGGALPYADCSTMAQLSARILVERRPPDVPQTVPPPLAALIRRCVCFDPNGRYNANELHSELSKLRPQ